MIKNKRQAKYISPSILSADFTNMKKDLLSCERGGANFIHMDVMDGHFVPNISFGVPVIRSLRAASALPFDTHLMIENPEQYAEAFIDAGSNYLTFHVEASQNPKSLLQFIRSKGAKAGLSLRPSTHLKELIPYLREVDLILVMTVEPGFGGQEFMESQLGKIQELHTLREKHELEFFISVDGGINLQTGRLAVDAGADCLVAGSFVFKNNAVSALQELRNLPL
tara:strand:- start:1418 stop:2089 length:672 start_codon:yes stop_codon:yes gene_type:complete